MILFLLDLFDVEGKHLLLRMAGAALLSFLLVIALGPRMIRYLLRRKIGDSFARHSKPGMFCRRLAFTFPGPVTRSPM